MYISELWPLRSSRHLLSQIWKNILLWLTASKGTIWHQFCQNRSIFVLLPLYRAFEKFVDPWPILQGCKWQFVKKKQEHGQIPSKQAENEYNCKIRETKKTGNPMQKQENLQHWFWPRSRERNIWQICSCGHFCSLFMISGTIWYATWHNLDILIFLYP